MTPVGTHFSAAGPAAAPTHSQQQQPNAGAWGSGPLAAILNGAMGHPQAASTSLQQQQQQLPGPPDSAQLRKLQMVAADQEFQQQQQRHHSLQQAWAVQVSVFKLTRINLVTLSSLGLALPECFCT